MEIALKRLTDYAKMNFVGHLSIRDINGISGFENEVAIDSANRFALQIIDRI